MVEMETNEEFRPVYLVVAKFIIIESHLFLSYKLWLTGHQKCLGIERKSLRHAGMVAKFLYRKKPWSWKYDRKKKGRKN